MQLKYPVHFVCPEHIVWPELRNQAVTRIDDARLSKQSGGILNNWVLRTYYQLRLVGEGVTLSDHPVRGRINVVSVRDFGRRQRDPDCFLLIPQADAHHSQLADFRIRQNGLYPDESDSATIWHWPQPGILPRDPKRRSGVARLCFKGRLINLDEAFHSDAFSSELAEMGVDFEIDAFNGEHGDHSWNDYRNSDAVLAVRNLTEHDARKKPASKLVNAWFADVAAILGPEAPFQELRKSKYDYLEVRSSKEALEAVKFLRSNPDFFDKMIMNGRERRKEFTEERLTQLWIDTINGPVGNSFSGWKKMSKLRHRLRAFQGLLYEKRAKKRDRLLVRNGRRILE